MPVVDTYPDLVSGDLAAGDLLVAWEVAPGRVVNIALSELRAYLNGGAISTVDDVDLTANRALISNGSGKIAVSGTVSDTELGYLDGVTQTLHTRPVVNLLNNGNFDLWDKGTSFDSTTTPANNDDTYLLPRWLLLSDGDDIVDVSRQQGSPPDGSQSYIRLEQETTLKQFGLATFLEAKDAIPLRNKTVSLSFQARQPVALGTDFDLQAAVLAWDGPADSITSDLVSSWATTPTFATNWTAENTPSTLLISDEWLKFTIDGISLDTTTFNNLGVFIWTISNGGFGGDQLEIAQVQLELSPTATDFVPRMVAEEQAIAHRYYYRSTGGTLIGPNVRFTAGGASEFGTQWVSFPQKMRTTPTAAILGTWTETNCTLSLEGTSPEGTNLKAASSGSGNVLAAPNGTDDQIEADAEL